jgi:hypothetical protein
MKKKIFGLYGGVIGEYNSSVSLSLSVLSYSLSEISIKLIYYKNI